MKTKIWLRGLAVVLVILLIPSCAVNPVTGKRQLMLMSEQQELSLGAQYDPTVLSSFGVYENEMLQQFIETKGAQMGKISHRPNLTYHFRILDSPVVNAFAVPGGYIYLTRGILAQLNNEAELMGVIGHEMGHITARHTAQQQTNQQLGQILLVGGMLVSKEFAEFANYASAGMQLLFLSFSRANEREADQLGVEYSTKVGYDAHKMADFFEVLNKMQMADSHGGVPTWMSTHPDPGERNKTVYRLADEWQARFPGKSFAVNRDSYLRMIDGLVYGEDPRQGFVEDNVFYHPELRFYFRYPMGWKLENSPMQVQIVAPDKNALMFFSSAKQSNLSQAANETLAEMGVTPLESQPIKVNGFDALRIHSQQVSQDQQTGKKQVVELLSYFILKDGQVFAFHGISSGELFGSFLPAFESSLGSFALLKDTARLNVKPTRIKIVQIRSQSVSLRDALLYYKVPESRINELALLNNMNPDDILHRGDLIKVLAQ